MSDREPVGKALRTKRSNYNSKRYLYALFISGLLREAIIFNFAHGTLYDKTNELRNI